MTENQLPSCILRISTRSQSMPVEINVVPVVETENLLEDQEELIAPPVHIDFDIEVRFSRRTKIVDFSIIIRKMIKHL